MENGLTTTTGGLPAPLGLSFSGLKDLAISPLRYWHLHLNPNRPARPDTPAMQFGRAFHCSVLEPNAFAERYACALNEAAFDGLLETTADLKAWLETRGVSFRKSADKTELIRLVQEADATAPIWDVEFRRHRIENAGKTVLSVEDWERVQRLSDAVLDEPAVQRLMSEGNPEVWLSRTDEETGVLLRGRLDWDAPKWVVDYKTFTQQRGKSIDQSIIDAIRYEKYPWQAVFYSILKGYPENWRGDVALVFAESEEPHEVRIRTLKSSGQFGGNLYWDFARREVRGLIQLYADCMEQFGIDKPWRVEAKADPLADEECKWVVY